VATSWSEAHGHGAMRQYRPAMHATDLLDEARSFLAPERVLTREEVLARPSPVPKEGGVYGWWFNRIPPGVDASRCRTSGGLTLLYTGISPKRPPTNGRAPSQGQLRQRLETHYMGNASSSTLRKTLGCLLADELGIQLRRVGSGSRRTFVEGEQLLSQRMGEHALVSFVVRDRPWELEDHLIESLDLPLNLQGNRHNRFHRQLTEVRARCVTAANALPVIPNPRVGGR
jgi:hypothetical protein